MRRVAKYWLGAESHSAYAKPTPLAKAAASAAKVLLPPPGREERQGREGETARAEENAPQSKRGLVAGRDRCGSEGLR